MTTRDKLIQSYGRGAVQLAEALRAQCDALSNQPDAVPDVRQVSDLRDDGGHGLHFMVKVDTASVVGWRRVIITEP